MRFVNGEEMLKVVQDGTDLYNKNKGLYVFIYNDMGSIAVYNISEREAEFLAKEKKENPDLSWSEMLGAGGRIYDSLEWLEENGESYGDFNEFYVETCADWCNTMCDGEWVAV